MLTTYDKLVAEHLGVKVQNPADLTDLDNAIRANRKAAKPKFQTEKQKRYRLHKKVKRYVFLYPGKRLMLVDDINMPDVPAKEKAAIFKLRDDYGYTLQLTIPNN